MSLIIDPHNDLRHMADRAHLFWRLRFRTTESEDSFSHPSVVFDQVATNAYEPDLAQIRRDFYESPRFVFEDPAPKYDWNSLDQELLFSAASPIADLLPALAAHAVLLVTGEAVVSADHGEGPRAHYIGPQDQDLGLMYASDAKPKIAAWELEALGWKWDQGHREAVAMGKGPGRPRTLRATAIQTLLRFWDRAGEDREADCDTIDRIRIGLRWFFPLDQLTRKRIQDRSL